MVSEIYPYYLLFIFKTLFVSRTKFFLVFCVKRDCWEYGFEFGAIWGLIASSVAFLVIFIFVLRRIYAKKSVSETDEFWCD